MQARSVQAKSPVRPCGTEPCPTRFPWALETLGAFDSIQGICTGKCPKGDTGDKAGGNGRANATVPSAIPRHSPSAGGMTEFWVWERVEGAEGAGREDDPAGPSSSWPLGSAPGGQCPTPLAAQGQGPGSSIFPPAPGGDFSSRARKFSRTSEQGGVGGERRRARGKEKNPSWQVFRAQSRSGNASLPLIASRPDEFREETATEMLHKSHCCACVGCLLKEVKGHRLWYIKKKKKNSILALWRRGLCCFFIPAFWKLKPVWRALEHDSRQRAELGTRADAGLYQGPCVCVCVSPSHPVPSPSLGLRGNAGAEQRGSGPLGFAGPRGLPVPARRHVSAGPCSSRAPEGAAQSVRGSLTAGKVLSPASESSAA